MMKATPPSALVLTLVIATGCTEFHFSDSVDFELDLAPLITRDDYLHSPYVRGADMTVWADDADPDTNMTGWAVQSSNAAVFSLGRQESDERNVQVRAHAAGEGRAELTLLDPDREIAHEAVVEVRVPDEARVFAHGPLILGRAESEALIDVPKIATGGTATFLLRWFRAGRQLSGNGVLTVDAPADVTAEPRTSFLFEDREWLTITAPDEPGFRTLTLFADGEHVRELMIEAVVEDEVDTIAIHGQDEAGREQGDSLVALAQAYDADGEMVFGIDYEWDIDGLVEAGIGDLYRYDFDASRERSLAARTLDARHEAIATIHLGQGRVDSTNDIGCATTPMAPTSPTATLFLLLGLPLLPRRR